MTSYQWDVRCADVELGRLQDGFTPYDYANFTRVLLMGFQRVVKDIHIETGSLLSSARVVPVESTPHTWSGEISVGGASAGVNPVVRYAAAEFFGESPKHGGPPSHSFFRGVGWAPEKFGGSLASGGDLGEDMMGPASSFLSRGRRTPHPEGPVR